MQQDDQEVIVRDQEVIGDQQQKLISAFSAEPLPVLIGRGKQSNQLPITRVKNIIKSDPDITLASQEATIVISKATELFLRHLSRQSYVFTVRGKRKTIQRRDVVACLPQRDEFAFLEGAID